QHHTAVDVTLATFEGMFMGRPGKISPDFAPVLNRLPAQVQRAAYSGGLPVTEENDQLYKDSYQAMLRMTSACTMRAFPFSRGRTRPPESCCIVNWSWRWKRGSRWLKHCRLLRSMPPGFGSRTKIWARLRRESALTS